MGGHRMEWGIECGAERGEGVICFFAPLQKKKWSTGIFLLYLYGGIIIV